MQRIRFEGYDSMHVIILSRVELVSIRSPLSPLFFAPERKSFARKYLFAHFFNNPSIPRYDEPRYITAEIRIERYSGPVPSVSLACVPPPKQPGLCIHRAGYLRSRDPLLITTSTSVFRPVDEEGRNKRKSFFA